ncbi:MAG: NAD-dependent epimerase/dehydratase family protein, partial [Pseudomonadota bacterium]
RAFNGELTARLYRAAARADAARFIWLSSAKVLGEVSRAPLPVTAPLAPQGAYAHSKAAGERALQHEAARGGPALCIVRPPLVYGPGVGANFAALLRWALRGRALPLGRASAPRSLVGVRNLCSALLAAIEAPAGIYHVTDGPALSVAALLRAVGHSARRDVPLWRIPPALMALGATLVGRRGTYERLFTSLELATADSETRLSWQPPFSFEQQLQETVDWFLTQR